MKCFYSILLWMWIFYCWWIIEVAKPAPSKKAKVTKAAAKEESSDDDDDDEEGI